MNSTAQLARDPQAQLPTGPTHVASRSAPPPRTAAEVERNRAFLAAAGRVEFGRYEATLRDIWMAFAYFASLSDARECYGTGEHIAEKARRSGRTVRRHVPALIDRGLIQSDKRKGGRTPSTWSVVLPADVRGLTSVSPDVLGGQDVRAGRTGCPGRADTVSNDIRNREKVQKSTSSSRARVVCKICGNDWPASYGTDCHKCRKNPKLSTWTPADDTPTDEPKACTCGDAYRNAYGGRCVECKGKPSAAQRDALREKHDCRGEDDRVGEDGGVGDNPAVPETETGQPPETRGQRPDSFLPQKQEIPPDGGEPGPNERRFYADFAQWTVGKRPTATHRSDRRRLARAARQELAKLAKGEQADDGHTDNSGDDGKKARGRRDDHVDQG